MRLRASHVLHTNQITGGGYVGVRAVMPRCLSAVPAIRI